MLQEQEKLVDDTVVIQNEPAEEKDKVSIPLPRSRILFSRVESLLSRLTQAEEPTAPRLLL